MVGPARFELAASSSRTRRSTKLSHGPTVKDPTGRKGAFAETGTLFRTACALWQGDKRGSRAAGKGFLGDDLGADACVGEDFEEETVLDVAADHVDFFNAF